MLVKMEGFITEAVVSCTGGTNMADNISQETPVSCYSRKLNDRSCNQSAEGQSAVQQNDAITITQLSLPTESCDNCTATAVIIAVCNLVTGNHSL